MTQAPKPWAQTRPVRPALPASGGLTFRGQARISGDIFNASCVLSGDL